MILMPDGDTKAGLEKAVGDMLRNGEDVEIVNSDLNEIY